MKVSVQALLLLHPDKVLVEGDKAASSEKFVCVQNVYKLLGDEDKRRSYEEWRDSGSSHRTKQETLERELRGSKFVIRHWQDVAEEWRREAEEHKKEVDHLVKEHKALEKKFERMRQQCDRSGERSGCSKARNETRVDTEEMDQEESYNVSEEQEQMMTGETPEDPAWQNCNNELVSMMNGLKSRHILLLEQVKFSSEIRFFSFTYVTFVF